MIIFTLLAFLVLDVCQGIYHDPLPTLDFLETSQVNFSLLSFGQKVSLNLEKHFKDPQQTQTNFNESSQGISEIISIKMQKQPINQTKNFTMQASYKNKTKDIDVKLNQSHIIQTKSIYNQPTKLFLLDKNIFFNLRYSPSDQQYIEVIQIASQTKYNCTNFEQQFYLDDYYLYFVCYPLKKRINQQIDLFLYKFNKDKNGLIGGAVFMDHIDITVAEEQCKNFKLFSFDQLAVKNTTQKNKILLFCASKGTAATTVFLLYTSNNKIKNVKITNISSALTTCLGNNEYIVEYEDGFMSSNGVWLTQFSNSSGQAVCSKILNITNYSFISSLKQSKIQYIYIIFPTKIYIKESYSPNYQYLMLHPDPSQKLMSYAMTNSYLMLHFLNTTSEQENRYYVYDITSFYPQLIDIVDDFLGGDALFSVYNYLENSNYFLVEDYASNKMFLKRYLSYSAEIQTTNSMVEGNLKLVLQTSKQQLVINLFYRNFYQSSIIKKQHIQPKFHHQIMAINLSKLVYGPLADFRIYPNQVSQFEYINQLTELELTTFFKDEASLSFIDASYGKDTIRPTVTFYYDDSIKVCQILFEEATRQIRGGECRNLVKNRQLVVHPKQIIVLDEQCFLQFEDNFIEYCEIDTNKNIYRCSQNMGAMASDITEIKLVRYGTNLIEKYIEIFIIMEKQFINRCYLKKVDEATFSRYDTLSISDNQLEDLESYNLRTVYFDDGYNYYLVLHLTIQIISPNDLFSQKVLIFDKPVRNTNTTSKFIGHLMRQFQKDNIEGVLFLNSNLILVLRYQNQYHIEEYYLVQDQKIYLNRRYPLYGRNVVSYGKHQAYGDYVFIEVSGRDQQVDYLVYCPKLSTVDILTHQLPKNLISGSNPLQQLRFIKSLSPKKTNIMFMNGHTLTTLSLPNLVLKLNSILLSKSHMLSLINYNVSVIDSHNVMKIIPDRFIYDYAEWSVKYDFKDMVIWFEPGKATVGVIQIEAQSVVGPVNNYSLAFNEDQCENVNVVFQDILSKQKCLLYNNTKRYGSMQDFIFLANQSTEIQIIVTQSYYICVSDRRIQRYMLKQLTKQCKIELHSDVIMVQCYSIQKMQNQLKILNYSSLCNIQQITVQNPSWFKYQYQHFNLTYSKPYLVYEVPIRFNQNKIYYKAVFYEDNSTIAENYSIIKNGSREEFLSKDVTVGDGFMLLLQNGLGVYNLSDADLKMAPMIWISMSQITSSTNNNEQMEYVKYERYTFIDDLTVQFDVELGFQTSSIQLQILLSKITNSTSYSLVSIQQKYMYEQYIDCKNTIISKSKKYQDLVIKLCYYYPQNYYIFQNYMSITHQTPKFLLQFYKKSDAGQSYPFRIEQTFSNFNSNDNFQIFGSSLVIGSLFNLICYYEIKTDIKWTFNLTKFSRKKSSCAANLILKNSYTLLSKEVKIVIEGEDSNDLNWLDPKVYIQRIIMLLVVLNSLRLFVNKIREKKDQKVTIKKTHNKFFDKQFEVMVKLNSKKAM